MQTRAGAFSLAHQHSPRASPQNARQGPLEPQKENHRSWSSMATTLVSGSYGSTLALNNIRVMWSPASRRSTCQQRAPCSKTSGPAMRSSQPSKTWPDKFDKPFKHGYNIISFPKTTTLCNRSTNSSRQSGPST